MLEKDSTAWIARNVMFARKVMIARKGRIARKVRIALGRLGFLGSGQLESLRINLTQTFS